MQGILLAKAFLTRMLPLEIGIAFMAQIGFVKEIEQTAMIGIRMGEKHRFRAGIKIRNLLSQTAEQFVTIAGVAGINAEQMGAGVQNAQIAAAGRFDERDGEIVPALKPRDTRKEGVSPMGMEQLCVFRNIAEGLIRRLAALVEQIHNQIGVDDQLFLIIIGEVEFVRKLICKRAVKGRIVEYFLSLIVFDDFHAAIGGRLTDKIRYQ